MTMSDAKRGGGAALTHVDSPGYENEQGVHFAMMNGDLTVRVLVTRAALQGRPPADGVFFGASKPREYFSKCLQTRNSIWIARTAKVVITAADLLGGGERACSD
jgi:hypothetical protein